MDIMVGQSKENIILSSITLSLTLYKAMHPNEKHVIFFAHI